MVSSMSMSQPRSAQPFRVLTRSPLDVSSRENVPFNLSLPYCTDEETCVDSVPDEHAKSLRVVQCCAGHCNQCRSRDEWARGKMWMADRLVLLSRTDCFFFHTTEYSFGTTDCFFFLKVRFFNFKVRHSLIVTSSKFSITRQGLFQESRQN